jgi:hypothetical protein
MDRKKMKIYQFRVSIMGISNLYRIIEASENCTFDDLHETIFQAFDRFDEHLYSFFITREDARNIRTIYNAPKITHPMGVDDIMGLEKNQNLLTRSKLVMWV